MQRHLRSASIKKTRVRAPSGTVMRFRRKNPNYMQCGNCGAKMVRKRLRPAAAAKLSKTQKRPERPLPHLCSRCMREQIKMKVRGM